MNTVQYPIHGNTLIISRVTVEGQASIDDWFLKLAGVLKFLGIHKLIFRAGGSIEIPKWFEDLCQRLGIEIIILDSEKFDQEYPYAVPPYKKPVNPFRERFKRKE